MAKRYSIADARANLPALVDQAEAGHDVELTRRGKPVAVIVSLRVLERLRSGHADFGQSYRQFLKAHSPREHGIEPDYFEALRETKTGRKVAL